MATGAGLATGVALPIGVIGKGASAGKAALTGIGAGYGAAFGALSARKEEERIEGALSGLIAWRCARRRCANAWSKADGNLAKDPNATIMDEVAELSDSDNWTDINKNIRWWDQNFVGVADAIRRRISPEVGGRMQRADETAMRQRNLEAAEFVENADMQRVIKLVERRQQV